MIYQPQFKRSKKNNKKQENSVGVQHFPERWKAIKPLTLVRFWRALPFSAVSGNQEVIYNIVCVCLYGPVKVTVRALLKKSRCVENERSPVLDSS